MTGRYSEDGRSYSETLTPEELEEANRHANHLEDSGESIRAAANNMVDSFMNNAADRQYRQNIRNFLLTATADELRREIEISEERGDTKRARYVRELLDETLNDQH